MGVGRCSEWTRHLRGPETLQMKPISFSFTSDMKVAMAPLGGVPKGEDSDEVTGDVILHGVSSRLIEGEIAAESSQLGHTQGQKATSQHKRRLHTATAPRSNCQKKKSRRCPPPSFWLTNTA